MPSFGPPVTRYPPYFTLQSLLPRSHYPLCIRKAPQLQRVFAYDLRTSLSGAPSVFSLFARSPTSLIVGTAQGIYQLSSSDTAFTTLELVKLSSDADLRNKYETFTAVCALPDGSIAAGTSAGSVMWPLQGASGASAGTHISSNAATSISALVVSGASMLAFGGVDVYRFDVSPPPGVRSWATFLTAYPSLFIPVFPIFSGSFLPPAIPLLPHMPFFCILSPHPFPPPPPPPSRRA